MEWKKAYKGFNLDMTCRGFQFEEGKEYHEDRAKLCEAGFHACEMPLDVLRYYAPATSVYHEVEIGGDTGERVNADSKICGTDIRIGARISIAELLEKKLYQDFQAFDASAVQAGNQTATAIKASYVPLDLKIDKFEDQVTEFINGILALAGVEDKPTYTRNQIINKQEEIQSVLMVAPYVTKEYLTRKLLTILGDADQVDEILKQLEAEELDRLGGSDDLPNDDNDETKVRRRNNGMVSRR